MGSYTLSGKADADIEAVAEASLRQWGLRRTEKYIPDLHETFQMLVEFPDLGRDAGDIRPGYRKIETGGHSVFYRKTEEGVLIVRILHQSTDFERHL